LKFQKWHKLRNKFDPNGFNLFLGVIQGHGHVKFEMWRKGILNFWEYAISMSKCEIRKAELYKITTPSNEVALEL